MSTYIAEEKYFDQKESYFYIWLNSEGKAKLSVYSDLTNTESRVILNAEQIRLLVENLSKWLESLREKE
jgi:hypothetical protein